MSKFGMLLSIMLVLNGCAPATVLRGEKAGVAANKDLPPSPVSNLPLTDERYYPNVDRPWLLERSSGHLKVTNIHRAVYYPSSDEIQIEYTDHTDTLYVEWYPWHEYVLLTKRGPCVATDTTFVCP